MDTQTCKSCTHFQQHYSFDGKTIFRVYCGHCRFQKVRRKTPDAPACENYVHGDGDEAAFVRKEFLSKELLRYMMNLDLLPEIKDEER